jgi:hypothetical protein
MTVMMPVGMIVSVVTTIRPVSRIRSSLLRVDNKLVTAVRDSMIEAGYSAHSAALNALGIASALSKRNVVVQEEHPEIGKWLSAALDDPMVCKEMKTDINNWFNAGAPYPLVKELA